MAQTRKQLNNKLTIATAQLKAAGHETRRTLNERVKAAETVQKELAAKVNNLLNNIGTLEAENEKLADRVAELEKQVNGDAE